MSEFGENYEHKPIPPILQFYVDIHEAMSAQARQLAVSTLYETLLNFAPPATLIDELDIDYEIEDETNWRLAKERLLIFPIIKLGPILEHTDESTDLDALYRTSVEALLLETHGLHDDACYDASITETISCEHSTPCPIREVIAYCFIPALNFTDLEYQLDYTGHYRIILSRLEAIRETSLLDTSSVDTFITRYKAGYIGFFSSTLGVERKDPEVQS